MYSTTDSLKRLTFVKVEFILIELSICCVGVYQKRITFVKVCTNVSLF